MKKLLGIAGTIIIAGSGMAGIIGNKPATAKNEINYSKTNNLEKLNRSKRSWNDLNNASKGAIIGASIVGGAALVLLTGGTILAGAGLGAATGLGALSGSTAAASGLLTVSGAATVATGTITTGAVGAGVGAGIGAVV